MADERPSTGIQVGVLVGALLACFAVAAIGGLSTSDAVQTWYPNLDKPPWTPPDWAFGPIWTVLYISMAVGFWLAWRNAREQRVIVGLFVGQLALNLAWSPVFFGAQLVALGLVVIVALWLAIAVCIARFWLASRAGALLYVPYLVWITIATSLNAWILLYN